MKRKWPYYAQMSRQERKVGPFGERYHNEWNIGDVAEDGEGRLAEITTMR